MFLVFLLLFQHFFFSFSKWIFFHYAWPQCVQWSMSWGMDRGENALWIFRHSSFLSLSHHVKRKMCESILEEPRGPRGCRGRRKSKGIKAEETCCLFLLGWLPGNRHFMVCFWMKASESGGCGEGCFSFTSIHMNAGEQRHWFSTDQGLLRKSSGHDTEMGERAGKTDEPEV